MSSNMATEAARRKRATKIAAVVSAYFTISISLVFTNKLLMSDRKRSMDAPLFVTWFQCVVTVLICWVLGKVAKNVSPDSFIGQFEFPEVKYNISTGLQCVRLSMIFVAMITFNNLTLKYVEVSFYNVARSLTIVYNVVFSYYLLNKTTTPRTLVCLGVVVLGFYLGTEGEVNFSLIGSIFGLLASCFVSLNSIYTKKTLALVDDNMWVLQSYNNINACILFLPLIIVFGEVDEILARSDLLFSPFFWGMMTLGGVFGFCIGIASMLQIKTTSALTHTISGTAKAAVQSIMAFYIWGNATTAANVAGIATVLGGSLAYSYVRKMEMDAKDAKADAAAAAASSDGAAAVIDEEVAESEMVPLKSAEQP